MKNLNLLVLLLVYVCMHLVAYFSARSVLRSGFRLVNLHIVSFASFAMVWGAVYLGVYFHSIAVWFVVFLLSLLSLVYYVFRFADPPINLLESAFACWRVVIRLIAASLVVGAFAKVLKIVFARLQMNVSF